MNKININKGRNLMKTMAAVVLVGMSTAGCVDMDLSPNGKPAEGNVWSTPTLAEQTIAGVYNQLYVDYSDVANGWFDIWSVLWLRYRYSSYFQFLICDKFSELC